MLRYSAAPIDFASRYQKALARRCSIPSRCAARHSQLSRVSSQVRAPAAMPTAARISSATVEENSALTSDFSERLDISSPMLKGMEDDGNTTRRSGFCTLATAFKRVMRTVTKARLAATKAAPNSPLRSRSAPGGGCADRRGMEAPNYRGGTSPAANGARTEVRTEALNLKDAGSRDAAPELHGPATIRVAPRGDLSAHPLAIACGIAAGALAGAVSAEWLLMR